MISREFLLLAVAHWLALASPGPDFFLLLRNTWRYGRRHGLGTSFGIACANGAYILLALSGFSLLQQYPLQLWAMKWLAAVYLAHLGWASLRSAYRGRAAESAPQQGAGSAGGGLMSGIWAGMLAAGMNPKNALFYLGLFTLLVDHVTAWPVKAGYGLWMFALVFIWDAALVLLVSGQRVAARVARYQVLAEGLAGAVLLLLALAIGAGSFQSAS